MVAAIALGGIDNSRAIVDFLIQTCLKQALTVDDLNIRTGAVIGLGRLGDEKAVGPLINVLNEEYKGKHYPCYLDNVEREITSMDENMRIRAAWALSEIGSPKAIEALIQFWEEGEDSWIVKCAALRSLADTGDKRGLQLVRSAMADRVCYDHKADLEEIFSGY